MNVIDCPTPKKRSYPTRVAAEAKVSVSSTKQNPYLCQCGAWHLTMRATAASASPSDDVVEALSAMSDEDFDKHVLSELYGKAKPGIATALRTPEIALRWAATLKRMDTHMHAEFAKKKGLDDQETKDWRAAMVRRQGFIYARLLEAKAIAETEKAKTSEEQLRFRAATAAKRRLISQHWEEYRQYLTEELASRGLEFIEAPDRQAR